MPLLSTSRIERIKFIFVKVQSVIIQYLYILNVHEYNLTMEWLQKAEGLLQAVDQTARAVKSGQQTSLFGQTGTVFLFQDDSYV